MKTLICCLLSLLCADLSAETKAKNVILFLGDAGGISTLNAAGIYGNNRPLSLFIHRMPHCALAETSALDNWVTDSAAGMTAIVTGRKTNNGMLSVAPDSGTNAVRPLKTILEHAEVRGLSTGVVTNRPVWDATPAACWAHIDSRQSTAVIFDSLLKPAAGNGVDIVIGADREGILTAAKELGVEADEALRSAGYEVFNHPSAITTEANRYAAIYDGEDFEPAPVVSNVVKTLSRNPRGFFLMVEWDMHTNTLEKGLQRTLVMDSMIQRIAAEVTNDTLIIFAADHSFDLRIRGGNRSEPLVDQMAAAASLPPALASKASPLRVDNSHTGEEILVAAQGPGANRVRGFISNTDIFQIMLSAYGWSERSSAE